MTAVRLRRFQEADAHALLRWIRSEEEMVMWSGPSFRWPLDVEQLMAFPDTLRVFAAIDAETGRLAGHLRLWVAEPYRLGRFGAVLVDPELRGRGYGSALIGAALEVAFGELRLHRVGLGVYTQNEGARRVYEKAGFVREGLIRDAVFVNGAYWSDIEMGILESERRAKL
ncbi:GNAT family N-acetyltransferase [Fodinicola acaciae]|uniref:GNAT family N-acetyltransferase n=1 Tax=Fodinicola acaciae TaxID=2681555 RepID=UPI0013D0ACFB|nr:GNAT family protein [Fodinicola acaciae]